MSACPVAADPAEDGPVENNLPLFITVPGFFRWADKRLKAAK